MRAIKFRGKALPQNKWLYGDLLTSDDYKVAVIRDHNSCVEQRVGTDTVGQFTGLLDCNGKEIYEGDILSLSKAKKQVFEVYYNEHLCSFCLREYTRTAVFQGSCPLGEMLQLSKPVVIIGNVFDNPELLSNSK
jgi:uncharacterized phage protein (TIGR01671 family)